MSQFPPPQPQGQYPPPQGQYPPPGQYPPQGQVPPGGYSMAPAAKAGNGMAVASLVCGFLFCIPAITGLLAVVFGLAGFSRGKDPRRGGRGMAMAGIILGLVSLVAWSGIGYGVYWGVGQIKAFVVPTTGLMETLSKNDIPGARQYVTSAVSDADLANARQKFSALGEFVRLDAPNFVQSSVNGVTTYTLTGKGVFAKGSCDLTVSFDKDPQGNIKVSQLKVQ